MSDRQILKVILGFGGLVGLAIAIFGAALCVWSFISDSKTSQEEYDAKAVARQIGAICLIVPPVILGVVVFGYLVTRDSRGEYVQRRQLRRTDKPPDLDAIGRVMANLDYFNSTRKNHRRSAPARDGLEWPHRLPGTEGLQWYQYTIRLPLALMTGLALFFAAKPFWSFLLGMLSSTLPTTVTVTVAAVVGAVISVPVAYLVIGWLWLTVFQNWDE